MRTATKSSKAINTAFNLSVVCLVVMVIIAFQKIGIIWPSGEQLMSMKLLYDVIGGLVVLSVALHVVIHVVELHKRALMKNVANRKSRKVTVRQTYKTARSFVPSVPLATTARHYS